MAIEKQIASSGFAFKNATNDAFKTIFSSSAATSDKTLTFPNVSSTLAAVGLAQTFTEVQTFSALSEFTLGLSVNGGAAAPGSLTVSGTTWQFGLDTTVKSSITEAGAATFASSLTTPSVIANNGANTTTISRSATVANYAISLPDLSGTFALTANKLSAFAATTSAELAGVISDETGSGSLVFGTSPTFTTQITTPIVTSAALQLNATTTTWAATSKTTMTQNAGTTYALNVGTDSASVNAISSTALGALTFGPATGSIITHILQSGDATVVQLKSGAVGKNPFLRFYRTSSFDAEISSEGVANFNGSVTSVGDLCFRMNTASGNFRFINSSAVTTGTLADSGAWTFGTGTGTGLTHIASGETFRITGGGGSGQYQGLEIYRDYTLTTQRTIINHFAGETNFVSQTGTSNGSYNFKLYNGTTLTSIMSSSNTGAWTFGQITGTVASDHTLSTYTNGYVLTLNNRAAASASYINFKVANTAVGSMSFNSAGSFGIYSAGEASTLASCTSAGAWTFGPTGGTAAADFHTINNGLLLTQVNNDLQLHLQRTGTVTSNCYIGTFDNSFNKLLFGTTPGGSELGIVDGTGAWTFGPTSGFASLTHYLYGNVDVGNTTVVGERVLSIKADGGNRPVLKLFNGASVEANLSIGASFDIKAVANVPMKFFTNNVEVGSVSAAGTWTLGRSDLYNLHTVYGAWNAAILETGASTIKHNFSSSGTTTTTSVLSLNRQGLNSGANVSFIDLAWYNGVSNGLIGTNGSSVFAISTPSDIRLKKDIKEATYGINTIKALRPVEFKWISQPDCEFVKGFIAQEVENILPEAITRSTDGMLSMETGTMIPILVKAVQELSARLEALENK